MSEPKFKKKFDKVLFLQFDGDARALTKLFFEEEMGVKLIDNPDQFSIDLVSEDGFKVETEVKTSWKNNSFPFKDIRYNARKKKFLTGDLTKTFFVTVNFVLGCLCVVPGEVLAKAPIVETENRYSQGQKEAFYVVDINTPGVEFFIVEMPALEDDI